MLKKGGDAAFTHADRTLFADDRIRGSSSPGYRGIAQSCLLGPRTRRSDTPWAM